MIVFVDSEGRIKAVGKTTDSALTPLEILDNEEANPFIGWSKAKICCYMVTVTDGYVTMMTPYVDSRIIDHIDFIGHEAEDNAPYEDIQSASFGDTEVVFEDVPDGIITVDARDMEGNMLSFHVTRNGSIVRVFFDSPLSYAADIRILVS